MTAGGFGLSYWVVSDAAPSASQDPPGRDLQGKFVLLECRQLLEPWEREGPSRVALREGLGLRGRSQGQAQPQALGCVSLGSGA